MAKDSHKRELKFASLDEIVAEATRLLEVGYEPRGNWNLGQTCFHLVDWMRFPMDGFPKTPIFLRAIFGGMKMLGIVERMKNDILANGFKAGTPTAPQTVPASDAVSDADGVAKLAEVLERMKTFDGPLQPSPLFGSMDREMWQRINLLHAEHHLAFLAPKKTA